MKTLLAGALVSLLFLCASSKPEGADKLLSGWACVLWLLFIVGWPMSTSNACRCI